MHRDRTDKEEYVEGNSHEDEQIHIRVADIVVAKAVIANPIRQIVRKPFQVIGIMTREYVSHGGASSHPSRLSHL